MRKCHDVHLKGRFEIGCIVPYLIRPVAKAFVAPDSADVFLRFARGLREFGLHGCDSTLLGVASVHQVSMQHLSGKMGTRAPLAQGAKHCLILYSIEPVAW